MPKKRSKAASSAASAAALQRAGVMSTGFIGFAAFANASSADTGAIAHGGEQFTRKAGNGGHLLSPSAFYTGNNAQLAALFKSLSKKDGSTKVKTLQEFCTILETLKPPVIRESLSHWLYLFNRLTFENDKRIRELAISVLHGYCTAVPKAAIRNIDSVMATLLCGLFDPVREVGTRTRETIDVILPENDLIPIILRSQTLLIPKLLARLKPETADRGSDKRKEAVEERRDRLQSTAIAAIAYLVKLEINKFSYDEIISDSIWAFLSSTAGVVRVQAYNLVRILALHCSHITVNVEMLGRTVCKAIGKEKEIFASKPLWDMVVALINQSNMGGKFWELVDYRKQFFPQVWKQLEDGLRGGGVDAYSNLMPFLSKIPDHIWKSYSYSMDEVEYHDGAPLMEKFLEQLWKGISSPNLGPHNTPHLIVALMECIALLFQKTRLADEPIGNAYKILMRYLLIGTKFYCEENRRYRIGDKESFKRASFLSLKQMDASMKNEKARQEAWVEFENICSKYVLDSDETADRVTDLVISLKELHPVSSMVSNLLRKVLDSDHSRFHALNNIFTAYPAKKREMSTEKKFAMLADVCEYLGSYSKAETFDRHQHQENEVVAIAARVAVHVCDYDFSSWNYMFSRCVTGSQSQSEAFSNSTVAFSYRSLDTMKYILIGADEIIPTWRDILGEQFIQTLLLLLIEINSSYFAGNLDYRLEVRKTLLKKLLLKLEPEDDFIFTASIGRLSRTFFHMTGQGLGYNLLDISNSGDNDDDDIGLLDILLCFDVIDVTLCHDHLLHQGADKVKDIRSIFHTALILGRSIASLDNGDSSIVAYANVLDGKVKSTHSVALLYSRHWLESALEHDNDVNPLALAKIWAAVAYEDNLAASLLIRKPLWYSGSHKKRYFGALCTMFLTDLHNEASILGTGSNSNLLDNANDNQEPSWFRWELLKSCRVFSMPSSWTETVLLPKLIGDEDLLVHILGNLTVETVKSFEDLLNASVQTRDCDYLIMKHIWPFIIRQHELKATSPIYLHLETIAPVLGRYQRGNIIQSELLRSCENVFSMLPEEVVTKAKLTLDVNKELHNDPDTTSLLSEQEQKNNTSPVMQLDRIQSSANDFSKDDIVLYQKQDETTGSKICVEAKLLDIDGEKCSVRYFDTTSGEEMIDETRIHRLTRRFARGDAVLYTRKEESALIVAVHTDDPVEPYYTIRLDSGVEVQTTSKWLSPTPIATTTTTTPPSANPSGPKNMAQLNAMLAKARQAGDRKESKRLMGLIPSLAPKPVDSEELKSKELAAKRAKEEVAQEKFKEIKGLVQKQSASPDGPWIASFDENDQEEELPKVKYQAGQICTEYDSSCGDIAVELCRNQKATSWEIAQVLTWISELTAPWRSCASVDVVGTGIEISEIEAEEMILLLSSLEIVFPIDSFAIHIRNVSITPTRESELESKCLQAMLQVMHSISHFQPSFFAVLPKRLKEYMCRTTLLALKGNVDFVLLGISISSGLLKDKESAEGKIYSNIFPRKALSAVFECFMNESYRGTAIRQEASSLLPLVPPSCLIETSKSTDGETVMLSLDKLFELLWNEKDEMIRSNVFRLIMHCTSSDQIISYWFKQGSQIDSNVNVILPPVLLHHLLDGLRILEKPEMVINNLKDVIATLLGWLVTLKIVRRFGLLHPESRENIGTWLRNYKAHVTILQECFAWFGVLKGERANNRQHLLSSIPMPRALRRDKVIINVDNIIANEMSMAESYEGWENIRVVAGCVIVRTLRVLPALGRQWWADTLNRTDAASTLEFLAGKITPLLVKEEVDEIQSAVSAGAFAEDEMQVYASTVSRTVTTLYKKDGCKLEMVISIPEAYPFKAITVECTKQLGVPEKRWRRWVIQIVSLLSTQDGTVLDAVNLTKQNLDKEFEGIEPCPICYCVIHVQDHTMPRLECKTCHYKYHSKCVSTWFQKSKKNECPMCKQPWSGDK